MDIIDASLYHNEGRFNLKKYLKKKVYYSSSFDKYIKKWDRDDAVIRKQLGFCYRYFVVFVEDKKIFKLLSHPRLASSMYLLRGLVGLSYILNHKK